MTSYTSSSATATFWTTTSNKKYGVRIQFGSEQFIAENSPVSTSFSSRGWQGELEGTIKYTSATDLKADVPSAYKISYVAATDEEKAHLLVKIYSIDSAGKESDTYYAELYAWGWQYSEDAAYKAYDEKTGQGKWERFPEPSFSAYFKASQDSYNEMTPAAALIYGDRGWGEGGIRVVAPAILKEFIDGVEFGRDPEGTLFFNDIKDLGSNSYYDAFNISGGGVVVQFYANLESTGCYAQFVAKDANRAYGWGISCKKGSWNELEGGSAAAHVKKPSNEPSITITINAIGKTVKFPVEQGDTVINVRGNLLFKNLSKLTSGTTSFVNYNNDRILFLPKSGSKDFTAVFILELDKADESKFSSDDFESNAADATWSDSTTDYSLSYKGKFTYKAGRETNADKENIYMTFPTGIHQDGSYCLIFSTFTKSHSGSLKVPIVVKSQPVFNSAKTSFTILTDYYTWKGTTTDDWKTVTVECWYGESRRSSDVLTLV